MAKLTRFEENVLGQSAPKSPNFWSNWFEEEAPATPNYLDEHKIWITALAAEMAERSN